VRKFHFFHLKGLWFIPLAHPEDRVWLSNIPSAEVGKQTDGQGPGPGGKSRGWRNDLNGEAEEALMPNQIPHSGYPWVIPKQSESKKMLAVNG
jgi:hypothetical protein